jgi:hypothetical protein
LGGAAGAAGAEEADRMTAEAESRLTIRRDNTGRGMGVSLEAGVCGFAAGSSIAAGRLGAA